MLEGLDGLDAVLFHAPYCKLVQKALARLALNDFLRDEGTSSNGSLVNSSNESEQVLVNGNGVEKEENNNKLVYLSICLQDLKPRLMYITLKFYGFNLQIWIGDKIFKC